MKQNGAEQPRETSSCGVGAGVGAGRERNASGRCEVPQGLRDIMVCRMMSQDVGKGLDPKRDERKTSCTVGDEVCRGRQVMPRETRYATGDETYHGRQVQETGLEA